MNIFEYVREQQNSYESDTVTVSGKDFNQKERIDQIEIASLCLYEEDNSDAILGELVYDDIITDKVEKEAQILDFDTKHLDISPDKPTEESRYKAMLASNGTRDEMDRDRYGSFFNKWVRTYSKYGGTLSKETEDGPQVVSWHNVITDQTDILSGVIIEKHYYTPAELKKMGGAWDNVDDAIKLAMQHKESSATQIGRKSDTQGHYIEVHEIHGELSEDIYKEDGDPLKFQRKMIIVAGVNASSDEGDDTEKGVILYEADETKNPYKFMARNPIDGIALGRGLVEELLPQQITHNFILNEEMRMVAIAGKIFAKTNKKEIPNNVGKFDHLSVFKLNDDEYFELTSAVPSSLPGFRDLRQHILENVRNISGMHEAVSGEEGKANKPLGLHKLQNIEGHSRFKPDRQEIGFHFEEIVKDWTLPKALKRLRKKDELYTNFSDQQLIQLDRVIMNKALSRKFTEMTLAGQVITPEAFAEVEAGLTRKLSEQGKKRLVSGLRDFLRIDDGDVRIAFTDESFDKGDFFESRVSFVQLLGPQDPWSRAMIRKSMDEAGITPEELAIEEERAAQLAPDQAGGSASGVELPGNEQQAPAQQV